MVSKRTAKRKDTGKAKLAAETLPTMEPITDSTTALTEPVESAEPIAAAAVNPVDVGDVDEAAIVQSDESMPPLAAAIAVESLDEPLDAPVGEPELTTDVAADYATDTAPIVEPVMDAEPTVDVAPDAITDAASMTVSLPADFRMAAQAALKNELLGTLSANSIVLDAGAVERVDTAALQLLVVYQRELEQRGSHLCWAGTSPAFDEAADLLGLTLLLKLPAPELD